ncbi:MAG: MBL fold metallo-hydrolase [Aggregatilineales bacterium]
MKHLVGNVYGILTQFGFLNSYVLTLDDGVAVIDIGLDRKHVERLFDGLKKFGWSETDIKHIFITHAHYDHCGGLADLQRQVNATTYAHRLDAPIIRGEKQPSLANPDELSGIPRLMYNVVFRNPPTSTPARVDIELGNDDTLDAIYPGMQIVHLPGHSYGQIGVWLSQEKMLIGGDVMMRTPFRLTMPIRAASPDWSAAKDSIRKVGSMGVDALFLGHGQPITTGAATQIDKLVRHIG